MVRPSEKLLLTLIVVTLLLPVPLTIWVHFASPPQQFDWIANRTLAGVTVKKDPPRVALADWFSGDLQKGLSDLATENFGGRELLIRIYNEVLYRAFGKSYMISEAIIPGKNGNLFTRDYLADYGGYFQPAPTEETEALVILMKYISERLKELGSCFVVVITPSKATVYPEDIPARYRANIKNEERSPTNYETLVRLLKEYRVPYVDGRQITLEHKDILPVRAFPKTGIHWSRAVAFFTAAELLRTIERASGRQMPHLSESVERIDQVPDYADADLFRLMNLIQKPHQRYLHPKIQTLDGWQPRNGILTSVGASFMEEILEDLTSAQVFERMNQYNYFKVSRCRYPDRLVSSVDESSIPWDEDFWNTRAVVLEANEEAIAARHIRAFLMAALVALNKEAPRGPSADHALRPVGWGFGENENGNALVKRGFSSPEHQMTWISSPDAEVELPSPAQNTDLQLILEVVPSLEGGVSGRVVRVEANGNPVGALELVATSVEFYFMTIKASVNVTPSLNLHFSIVPSPGALPHDGSRELGLAGLALVPIKHPAGEAVESHLTVLNGK
jgi:hypothetical protein